MSERNVATEEDESGETPVMVAIGCRNTMFIENILEAFGADEIVVPRALAYFVPKSLLCPKTGFQRKQSSAHYTENTWRLLSRAQ